MNPGRSSDALKVVLTLKQLVSLSAIIVGGTIGFVDIKYELAEIKVQIEQGVTDRFRGSDQDRFAERLQVELDRHSRDTNCAEIHVPDWRRTNGSK